MNKTYQMFASDYTDLQVLFFYDKEDKEWFIDEASVMNLANLPRKEFVEKMNRADYRKTRKGRWIVSLIDAYLLLPKAPRDWVFKEHQEHLALRLSSGRTQDAALLSLRDDLRRFQYLGNIRKARSKNIPNRTLQSIRSRAERHIRMLAAYGLNEGNSVIIRDAVNMMEVNNGTTVA